MVIVELQVPETPVEGMDIFRYMSFVEAAAVLAARSKVVSVFDDVPVSGIAVIPP